VSIRVHPWLKPARGMGTDISPMPVRHGQSPARRSDAKAGWTRIDAIRFPAHTRRMAKDRVNNQELGLIPSSEIFSGQRGIPRMRIALFTPRTSQLQETLHPPVVKSSVARRGASHHPGRPGIGFLTGLNNSQYQTCNHGHHPTADAQKKAEDEVHWRSLGFRGDIIVL